MCSAYVKGKDLVEWRYSVRAFWACSIALGLYLMGILFRFGSFIIEREREREV